MAADGVVAFGAIGNLPWVYISILIVVDKALDSAVKMNDVGISDLLPPSAAGTHRGEVHAPDIGA
jgi:hypothetical protein